MDNLSHPALCLRLDRADGTALGLTSHDRALTVAGFSYAPHPGLSVSSIRLSGDWRAGGLDLTGGLDSDAIAADDLLLGRWNNARLSVMRVDWRNPDAPAIPLFTGRLGAVQMVGGQYSAQVLEHRPDIAGAARMPRTSPGCRARFCDDACGLNAARFTVRAEVSAIDGAAIILSAIPAGRLPDFIGGRLRWIDGPMRGVWADVAAVQDGALILSEAPMVLLDPPVQVDLVEGCDHRLSTCATRFGNAVNFRGEPHLPGMDLITRYPGG